MRDDFAAGLLVSRHSAAPADDHAPRRQAAFESVGGRAGESAVTRDSAALQRWNSDGLLVVPSVLGQLRLSAAARLKAASGVFERDSRREARKREAQAGERRRLVLVAALELTAVNVLALESSRSGREV